MDSRIGTLCPVAQASILPESAQIDKSGPRYPIGWMRPLRQLLGQHLRISRGSLAGEAHADVSRGTIIDGRTIEQQWDR
jgi:hypothetical protein